jgi:hypothetical protein
VLPAAIEAKLFYMITELCFNQYNATGFFIPDFSSVCLNTLCKIPEGFEYTINHSLQQCTGITLEIWVVMPAESLTSI